MVDWKERPRLIEYWPDGVEYVMGLDENGTSDIKNVIKNVQNNRPVQMEDRDFTLTGVVMNRASYDLLKTEMNDLKFSYWPPNGTADYKDGNKRVCFHSREIRKKVFPFNNIDHGSFVTDLSRMIEKVPTRIIASSINKEAHCRKYNSPRHPYHLAIDFILERYCKRLNELNQKGIIILESRGYKEDKFVLENIVHLTENGTSWNTREHFRNFAGAFFNPKWWNADNNQSSFVVLELADLISYPIHKYVRGGKTDASKDQAYRTFESKFFYYPRYHGWGLKTFP